MFKIHILNLTN